MKVLKIQKMLSIICSILGFILSLCALIVGLQGIGADGWEELRIIFIAPSIVALIIIALDFLITIDKIKRGLIYSCISSLIKVGIIACLIPSLIKNYKYEIQYSVSNLYFDLILIILLTIVAIPSVINVIKLINLKKNNK